MTRWTDARRAALALLSLALVLLAAPAPAGAAFRFPWACSGRSEASGERERYFQALRTEALALLDINRQDVNYTLAGLAADRGAPAGQEFARADAYASQRRVELARLLGAQQALRARVDEAYETAVRAGVVFSDILTTLADFDTFGAWEDADVEEYSVRLVEQLYSIRYTAERRAFTVVHAGRAVRVEGGRLVDGDPVDVHDGAHYLDLDQDIRGILRAAATRNTACRANSRVLHVQAALQADAERLHALEVALDAPVLRVEVSGGTLAGRVRDRAVTHAAFREAFAAAVAQIGRNIETEAADISALAGDDRRRLAQMPLVRAAVLRAHPEFEGIDCLVASEIHGADIALTALQLGGAIVGVGALLLGQPLVAAVVFAAVSGLGMLDAARAYFEYAEARRRYFTGVTRPGLVSWEYVEARYRSFLVAVAFVVADVALAVPGAWRAMRAAGRNLRNAGQALREGSDLIIVVREMLDPRGLRFPSTRAAAADVPMGIAGGHYAPGIAERLRLVPAEVLDDATAANLRETYRSHLAEFARGRDFVLPRGTTNGEAIQMLRDLTRLSGLEYGYLRLGSGRAVIRQGTAESVTLNVSAGERLLAHSHPGGTQAMSLGLLSNGAGAYQVLPIADMASVMAQADDVIRIVTPVDGLIEIPIPWGMTVDVATEHGLVQVRFPDRP